MAGLAFWLTLPTLVARAEPPPDGLDPAGTVRLVAVRGNDSLVLEDGRLLRLAGVALPRTGAVKPQQAVLSLTAGQSLGLYIAGKPDRWGRLPAHLMTADGHWLQGDLLRQGLARVQTAPDDRAAAARMLEAEAEARLAKRGLWGDPATALRAPEETPRLLDSVQVVEGAVTSVNVTHGFTYVNFGEDWRSGLGLKIPQGLLRRMPGDLSALAGRRLRVRGWIGKGAGPMMEISHPEQIELVDGPWPAKIPPQKELPSKDRS